jgi:CysZ protein
MATPMPLARSAPQRSSSGRSAGLGAGIRAFFQGLAFVVSTPGVWPVAMVPIVTAALVLGAFGSLGVWSAVRAASTIAAGDGAWEDAARGLLEVVLGAVALVVAALLALALAQPLSGWAIDRLVRRQERELGASTPPTTTNEIPRGARIAHSLGVSLLALVVGVPVLGALTLVDILFPVAAVVLVPIKFVVGSLLVAWDFLDYPFSLRGMSVGNRLRFIGRHFRAVLGFGMSAALLLLIPCVGLVVLPMGAAGAARLVREVES